jgi:hypothetical protein
MQYELQGHIASGAYGSVMRAFAAHDSLAADRQALINTIMRSAAATASLGTARPMSEDLSTHRSVQPLPFPSSPLLKSTLSLQRFSSPDNDVAALGDLHLDTSTARVRSELASAVATNTQAVDATWPTSHGLLPGAAPSMSPGAAASRMGGTSLRLPEKLSMPPLEGVSSVPSGPPMAAALRLALPSDDGGNREARKSAAGDVLVAVKVVTSPDDLMERCALADILTEVAIMDDVTTLFVQAAALSVASKASSSSLHAPAGSGGAGDDLPSARAPKLQHTIWASRQSSIGDGGSGGVHSSAVLNASDGCPTVCLLDFGITTGATWLVQVGALSNSSAALY